VWRVKRLPGIIGELPWPSFPHQGVGNPIKGKRPPLKGGLLLRRAFQGGKNGCNQLFEVPLLKYPNPGIKVRTVQTRTNGKKGSNPF